MASIKEKDRFGFDWSGVQGTRFWRGPHLDDQSAGGLPPVAVAQHGAPGQEHTHILAAVQPGSQPAFLAQLKRQGQSRLNRQCFGQAFDDL